jgi:hypothetical protein
MSVPALTDILTPLFTALLELISQQYVAIMHVYSLEM